MSMNDLPLTKKKKKWVKQFKPTASIKGKPLAYNAAVRVSYVNELIDLVNHMTDQTEREILKFFKTDNSQEYFALDESISVSARTLTNALNAKFNQLFSTKAKALAQRMVNRSDKASASSLHESLKDLSGGLSLKTNILTDQLGDILTASIAENVSLIKSIPSEYFTDIQGAVMRSITTGKGLQDLVPFIKRHKSITQNRAQLIAIDQTRKVYANINASRLQAMNLDKYEWVHSAGGQEPRRLHQHLNGQICSLSNPPIIQYTKGKQPEIRGKPGDLINCRCIMRPVISFEKGIPEE